MSHPSRKTANQDAESKFSKAVSGIIPVSPEVQELKNMMNSGVQSPSLHYAHLLTEVGKLGFVNVLGQPFNPTSLVGWDGDQALPGIMTLDIVPSIGRSDDINSGVNLAAKNVYTDIRRNNQGNIPYDPADVMLYFLGVDSVLIILAHVRRAFRVIANYVWKNRYTSDALLTAMGFNPSAMRENYGNDLARYNMIVTKASKLVYLKDFPLLGQHATTFSEVYKDGEGERAQMYLPRPAGVFKMSALPESDKKILEWQGLDYSAVKTASEWLAYAEYLINQIAYVTMYSNIAGQLERAYGPNVVSLPLAGDLNPLEPIYDKTFGWCLQNSTISSIDTASMVIREELAPNANLGALLFIPKYGNTVPDHDVMVYTTLDGLTAEEMYTCTKWKMARLSVIPDPLGTRFVSVGNEFITKCVVYYYVKSGDGVALNSSEVYGSVKIDGASDLMSWEDEMNRWTITSLLTNFKWYPYFTITGKNDPITGTDYYVGIFGNVDNYMKMTFDQFELIQDVRQLESFYLTEISTIS